MRFIMMNESNSVVNIEGFTMKPGFGIFMDDTGKLYFTSGWKDPWEDPVYMFMYTRQPSGDYEGDWVEIDDEMENFACRQSKLYMDRYYNDVCQRARKIPLARRQVPKITFWVNEYSYTPQEEPGVFFVIDEDNETADYVILTKKKFRRMMELQNREGDNYDCYC